MNFPSGCAAFRMNNSTSSVAWPLVASTSGNSSAATRVVRSGREVPYDGHSGSALRSRFPAPRIRSATWLNAVTLPHSSATITPSLVQQRMRSVSRVCRSSRSTVRFNSRSVRCSRSSRRATRRCSSICASPCAPLSRMDRQRATDGQLKLLIGEGLIQVAAWVARRGTAHRVTIARVRRTESEYHRNAESVADMLSHCEARRVPLNPDFDQRHVGRTCDPPAGSRHLCTSQRRKPHVRDPVCAPRATLHPRHPALQAAPSPSLLSSSNRPFSVVLR